MSSLLLYNEENSTPYFFELERVGVSKLLTGTVYPNAPGQWLWTLSCVGCSLSDGMLNGCPDSLCPLKLPIALIVRVGVLTTVSWLNSQSGPLTIMST